MTVQYIYDLYGGGRRKLTDRRQFTYTCHLPERRSNRDRRSGLDRRRVGRTLLVNQNQGMHPETPVLVYASG